MAITKTTALEHVEVRVAEDSSAADTTNAGNPTVEVTYVDTIDDTSDADLPADILRTKLIERYSDEDNQTATDVTGEAQLVQDICGAIWS